MHILRFYLNLGTICLLATIFLVSVVMGDAPPTDNNAQTADRNSKFYLLLADNSLYSNQPYQTEIKQIDSLGKAKNLVGLVQLADSIEQTWGHQTDTRGYFALMDKVTNVLRSYNFGFQNYYKQCELTQKYVLMTVAHDAVPLDITGRLLPRLIPQEELRVTKRPFDDSGWVEMRRTRAPLWLQTRQRLEELVIPNYDFTSPVVASFPYDPRIAKDAKRAKDRQQEIEENEKKLWGRNTQSLVRFQDKVFSPMAENEMIFYYSQAPYDTPELKRFLDTYMEDNATKQRILDTVTKNIDAASQKQ